MPFFDFLNKPFSKKDKKTDNFDVQFLVKDQEKISELLEESSTVDVELLTNNFKIEQIDTPFANIHDKLQLRYSWYDKWRKNRFTSNIHWFFLSFSIAGLVLLFISGYFWAPTHQVDASSRATWSSPREWEQWTLNKLVVTDNGLTLATKNDESAILSSPINNTNEVSIGAENSLQSNSNASESLSVSSSDNSSVPSTDETRPNQPSIASQYEPEGMATITFDPQNTEVVDWLRSLPTSDLNNGSIDVEFSTDNILWQNDVATMSNSDKIYLRITIKSSNLNQTPILKKLSLDYSRLPLAPQNLRVKKDWATLNPGEVLSADSFTDPDNDQHRASQWQVTNASGLYDSPIVDSGIDFDNLTSLKIDKTLPDGNYFFRVRYQDSVGAWSLWGQEAAFSVSKKEVKVIDIDSASQIPNEVVADRTEQTKTIKNPDGSFSATSYNSPIHYKEDYTDGNANWLDINPDHSIDYPDYTFYDAMPSTVKVFKDRIGYEIESRKTGEKYTVELQSVDGNPKLSAESNKEFGIASSSSLVDRIMPKALADESQVAIDNANLKFEFDISASGVRLWKTIEGADAPRNFTWKVTKSGSGDTLQFRENPEAFVVGDQSNQVTIDTEKTKINDDSFTWTETAPQTDIKIDTDVNSTSGAGAGTNATYGGHSWADPGYIISDDSSYATSNLTAISQKTDYLKAQNFGYAIPTGAVINGIQFDIKRTANSANFLDDTIKVIKADGSFGSSNLATSDTWNGVTEKTYGSTTAKWGETWTPAAINNSNFGLVVAASSSNTGSMTGSVDYITSTVTYTRNGCNFAGGDGSPGNPYQIDNLECLQSMNDDLSSSYKLVANIDARETKNWNGGAGFIPIGQAYWDGNKTVGYFNGNFDGNGKTIDNLTIDSSGGQDGVGLFSTVGNYDQTSSIITNIGLTNIRISVGDNTEYIGGLIGCNYGAITNSYSVGNITSTTSSYGMGGLAGQNYGAITDSYSTGTITSGSYSNDTSGLVGYNGGTITNSYFTGTVTSGSNSYETGGLIGGNSGTITSSYSESNITSGSSSHYIGGFVGYNSGAIVGSYSAGSITGGSGSLGIGGFIGFSSFSYGSSSTVNNNYWLNDGVLSDVGATYDWSWSTIYTIDVDGVTAISDAQMKHQRTFPG
ncbi:MAG: GLUG motif-containing protein, partial [bacterium]